MPGHHGSVARDASLGLVGLGVEVVGAPRPALGRDEQDQPQGEEDAEERVQLLDARQHERQDREDEAEPVDTKTVWRWDRPRSSSRWWMWPRSGLNGERPWRNRRTMIQKVSMIGTPRTSSATATLAVPRIARTARV